MRHFHLAGGESLEAAGERQLSECRSAAARLWADSGEARAGLLGLAPRTQTIQDNQDAVRLLYRRGSCWTLSATRRRQASWPAAD